MTLLSYKMENFSKYKKRFWNDNLDFDFNEKAIDFKMTADYYEIQLGKKPVYLKSFGGVSPEKMINDSLGEKTKSDNRIRLENEEDFLQALQDLLSEEDIEIMESLGMDVEDTNSIIDYLESQERGDEIPVFDGELKLAMQHLGVNWSKEDFQDALRIGRLSKYNFHDRDSMRMLVKALKD